MVTKSNYTSDGVQAAKSVMLELHRILGEYADHVVVIGGWVPELLISQKAEPHVGSMDVDLAINHWSIPKGGYKTIQPFIYHKTVTVGSKEVTVQVDFLAGEYKGTGKSHRTQKAQDLRPRKTRGQTLRLRAQKF